MISNKKVPLKYKTLTAMSAIYGTRAYFWSCWLALNGLWYYSWVSNGILMMKANRGLMS